MEVFPRFSRALHKPASLCRFGSVRVAPLLGRWLLMALADVVGYSYVGPQR